VILGAVFLQTLTNLLVALGWGDAGKWVGFGALRSADRLRGQPAQAVEPERTQLFSGVA
jgi:hypothetical protein